MSFHNILVGFSILVSGLAGKSSSAAYAQEKAQIESGFNLLYELRFEEARSRFLQWLQTHPEDPLGYEAIAAGYLFEEFYDQHVLTSEFFLNDKRLLGGIAGKPDERHKTGFEAANQKGRELAKEQLKRDPGDANALFALTIATGMQADYMAILEKRQMESLSLIKLAENHAEQLLALQPDEADAWLSIGAANYIIGSLPAYQRFFLWFRRIHGDKEMGMEQLKIAAERGHYLKPFAKIFLALAAMRENQIEVARSQLRDLVSHFPENSLFRAELARIEAQYPHSSYGER
jgi:tetratricopeptide (TPR) repeat protein